MKQVSLIGLDIAKAFFHAHALDVDGKAVFNRRMRRTEVLEFFQNLPRCQIVIEACSSSHFWARILSDLGHDVRLIAPELAKPFVKSGKKNDATDAAAIAQAARRTDLSYVPIKTEKQQAVLALHSARALLVKQRTMLSNALRNMASEFGLVAPLGLHRLEALKDTLVEDDTLPPEIKSAFTALFGQFCTIDSQVSRLTEDIVAAARQDTASSRLMGIPGVGPLAASMLVATVGDFSLFGSARQFSSWLGLVPRQNSTGGKARLGRITRSGNRTLRTLLVVGATAMLRRSSTWLTPTGAWLRAMTQRKPTRVATVALANKMARVIWAMMTRQQIYHSNYLAGASSVA
jgi:transposase